MFWLKAEIVVLISVLRCAGETSPPSLDGETWLPSSFLGGTGAAGHASKLLGGARSGQKQAMGLTYGLVQGSELSSKLEEWSSGCFSPAGLDKLLGLLFWGFFCGGADHKLGI